MKVGIIGLGTVGQAVKSAGGVTATYDKYNHSRTQNLPQLKDADIIFICVPTPTDIFGQNSDEVTDSIRMLSKLKFKGVAAIKSTVLPGTCDHLKASFPNVRIVHNPEFLTARTAKEDYLAQDEAIISGDPKDTIIMRNYFDKFFVKKVYVNSTHNYLETEWAKYIHNCMLAIKISFLNEVFQGMNKDEKVFKNAVSLASNFGNISVKNSQVPGPDGKLGFGGACFPKDMVAMREFLREKHLPYLTIGGAIETNEMVRK